MSITALPTPPRRDDPTNFATRADAFLGALPAFATEANALAVDVNADAVAAAAAEVAATAAASAATAAANVTKWVSGTTYAEGVVVWSPITYLSYRRKSAGAGTTDPSADSTNWAQAAGTGDVTLTGAQTLTNKTIAFADNTLTGVQPTLVSGTNIKTIGGQSVLGSGDLVISAGFTLGTPISTTSGTLKEYSGIPAGTKQVILTLGAVSVDSGSSELAIQLRTSGGYETSSYTQAVVQAGNSSAQSFSTSSSYFAAGGMAGNAGRTVSGQVIFTLLDATNNIWGIGVTTTAAGVEPYGFIGGGRVALSGALTGLKLYAHNGATFDAGSINIMYI